MNLLLDTHALVWFINGDHNLPDKSIQIIKNIENKCHVSVASIWELAIKLSLNKLELLTTFDEISNIMDENDIELLPITFAHINKLLSLDFHHNDPFDRIIIAQGIVEKLVIVTKDEHFPKYKVKTVWN